MEEETSSQEPQTPEEPTGEAPAEDQTPAEAETAATPEALYPSDGLESGLSWFGAEPRTPPLPPGQRPPVKEEEAAEDEAEARRLRVRQRLAARRREAEAAVEKKWFQKIPLGALSMIPIVIVLIVMVILYPPWGARVRSPAEKLDDKLLLREEVKNPEAVLDSLGIQAIGRYWAVIPLAEEPAGAADYAFVMTRKASPTAALKLKPPSAQNFTASCEVAILEKDPEYAASLAFEDSTVLALRSDERNLDQDIVRVVTRRGGNLVKATLRHSLEPRWWYKLEIEVEGSTVRYRVNGGRLPTAGERPPGIAEARIVAFNCRIAIRNLELTPAPR